MIWYAIFALATALTAIYEILYPVMLHERMSEGTVESQKMIYFVFFCIVLLVAPVVFLSCIIPSMGERFRNSLAKGLFPKE
jgi:hypothetical protein